MRLETDRLILRDFEESDWPGVHAYASDMEVVRWMNFGPNTEQETRDYLREAQTAAREEPRRRWARAVVVKATDRVIGLCNLTVTGQDFHQMCLGYGLHRDFWGQGYMTEAVRAVVAFGFRNLSLHRIFAEVYTENMPSARVLEKLGFRREAHFRQSVRHRGEWRDEWVYALLHHEWDS